MSEILKPRSLGELFSQTFNLIFTNLPNLIAIQAAFWLPVQLLTHFFITEALEGMVIHTTDVGRADPEVVMQGAFAGLALLSGLIIKPVTEAASMLVISGHFMGRKTAFGAAIGLALRKLFPLLVVAFAVTFYAWLGLVVVGFFAFVVLTALGGAGVLVGLVPLAGGFFVFAWIHITYGVAAPAVVLESLGAGAALQRSRTLTKGFHLKLFFLLAAILLIMLAIGAAIGVAVNVTPGLDPSAGLVEWGIKTVSYMVQLMLISVGIVVVYFDLRVRKDGFDLDNLAELVDVIAQRAAAKTDGSSLRDDE